ncbi:MAG: hypothetical protein HY315_03055 [Acidobacteria bacterium]|nr:hypothetical protein [Acidobacteriota bacterium]
MSRTTHIIAVDTVHDEIVAANPFAQALLFFRGGATGEEAPIRVIQGPRTMLGYTDNVGVDPQHNEVFVVQKWTNAILVYDREARGDVAPKRIIHGPKTGLDSARHVAVDPINDLLAVANRGAKNILIFNRTDEGDVAPRAILGGPKTGMTVHTVDLDPKTKNIIVPSGARTGRSGGDEGGGAGFVRVWKYGDNGEETPPRILVKGLETNGAMELIPDTQDLWIVGGKRPDLFHVYHLPELFR